MNITLTQPLDILLVDDHKMFIHSIKLLLKENKEINNIYEANDGITALEILNGQKIDIVITDFNMPEMTGIELTVMIKAKYPNIKIIVLTNNWGMSFMNAILHSEADGYIMKNSGKIELEKAINRVALGGRYFSNETQRIF